MPGRVLSGRYQVQDKIGTGGMATVFRGVDQTLGRTVAIKTMLPQYATDPSFAARFKQEAQAAAALREIGAGLAEELYGDELPEHQAEFAPGAAHDLLRRLGAEEETARRAAALLGPKPPEGPEAPLLREAELLLALEEGRLYEADSAALPGEGLQSELACRLFRLWTAGEGLRWS